MSSSAEPVGYDPDLEDQPSPELLEELGLGDVESNSLAGHRGHGSPLSVAWFEAIRATGTPAADKATSRYEVLRERIARLNALKPPWEERLSLLRELEAAGWEKWPHWERVRRAWLYRGREWRISISDEECAHLEVLGQTGHLGGWREGVADLLRAWYEHDTTLARLILQDPDGVWFVSTWVACRVWGREEPYARWLMDRIIQPVIRLRMSDLIKEDPKRKEGWIVYGDDLGQEAFEDLLGRLIPSTVQEVKGRLTAYWRVSVKHFVERKIQAEARLYARQDAPLEDGDNRGAQGAMSRLEALQGIAQDQLGTLAEIEEVARFSARLTDRQRKILFLKNPDLGLTSEEVAQELQVSLSTVEKERKTIREIAIASGLRAS